MPRVRLTPIVLHPKLCFLSIALALSLLFSCGQEYGAHFIQYGFGGHFIYEDCIEVDDPVAYEQEVRQMAQ